MVNVYKDSGIIIIESFKILTRAIYSFTKTTLSRKTFH